MTSTSPATVEPKKSARLAEKRKLREEAGPPLTEDDYYFTPLTRINRGGSRQSSVSPSPSKDRLSPITTRLTQVKVPVPILFQTQALSLQPQDESSSIPSTPVQSDRVINNELPQGAGSEVIEEKIQMKLEQQQPQQEKDESFDKFPDPKINKSKTGMILYINRPQLITLSLPPEMEYPFKPTTSPPIPPTILCGVEGCSNKKKYSCSKTKVPLCSLECYKKNLNTRLTIDIESIN